MVKIGMMIGNRYEILEKIGTGGTSDVYKAKCHKLNRYVAVKILKQEFSENAAFVAKFRTEAQAAAGLMHANIVNVYDVGEENGIYFIVMELVEGITLKNYIEKKGRLSVKEAVSIAIQVSLGIEAAHNNKIIHRDIKPQNIIISKEGRVKVTDFGIAKAATSNTITSNVMGSVHYTSPEQARGGYSDVKSDIYSLGITLFEMLTGRVPFNGETTVAIAIKHIQEEMPSPRQFVPDIPVSVEKIVMKCTQKIPDKRYRSMAELLEDLKKSLVMPDEDFVNIQGKNVSTVRAGVKNTNASGTNQPRNVAGSRQNVNTQTRTASDNNINSTQMWDANKVSAHTSDMNRENQRQSTGNRNREYDDYTPVKKRTSSDSQNKKKNGSRDEDSEDKTERVMTTIMVITVVVIGLIALYIVARVGGFFSSTPENPSDISSEQTDDNNSDDQDSNTMIEVNNVVGMLRNVAKVNLSDQGFAVKIVEVESETVASGYVISMDPIAGTRVKVGDTITITVSSGTVVEETTIPTLIGLTEDQLVMAIQEANLSLSEITYEYNDDYAAGLVCSINYPANQVITVPVGTEIKAVISRGPEQFTYSYNMSVSQPSNYNGNAATITLLGSDGSILYTASNITTFPHTAYVYPINNISWGYVKVEFAILSYAYDGNGNPYAYNDTETQETPVSFVKEDN